MYKEFEDINSLMEAVVADKHAEGAGSYVANRYPVRFVLFDNFSDSSEFVNRMASKTTVITISEWMEAGYPDVMTTSSKLADNIIVLPQKVEKDDLVVTPFSELARFYNNGNLKEFDALIGTIKSMENHDKADYSEHHRRIYIPIVGLAGKMARFHDDSQAMIWSLRGSAGGDTYNMVLTNGSLYGIRGLEDTYSIVRSVHEWLKAWDDQSLTSTILCSSPSIYANREYAQPDNAFHYCTCANAYELLTKGLGLDLNFLPHGKEYEGYWERLAGEIDIRHFRFDDFFNHKYDIYQLTDYGVFIKTWFEFSDPYMRWLLSAYYTHKFCRRGYICQVLTDIRNYTDVEFVTALETKIFDSDNPEQEIEERRAALETAARQDVVIAEEAQEQIREALERMAKADGYQAALKYMTTATYAEKLLMIKWLAEGSISTADIKDIYPALYSYLQPSSTTTAEGTGWIDQYIDDYKSAKLANQYTDKVRERIMEVNGTTARFNNWYSCFKTTRTLLDNRKDIEVYFWVDGLGIDWIPFIRDIIKKHENDGQYLNEIMVGKALLPTTTSVNKEDLERLTGGKLEKSGDIDEAAHHTRKYPRYIIDDMATVEKTIDTILKKNPGRKIAIVSDHGISFLSQLCEGLNLKGFESDHGGRLARKRQGDATSDDKYKVLDDKRTVCALRHNSLIAKIPEGAGCHGGCTPEEVLVPVFIVSNEKAKTNWTAILKTWELKTSAPQAVITIKGLNGTDKPYVIYNGKKYNLTKITGDDYQTERMELNAQVKELKLQIGTQSKTFSIKINIGVEEDNDFMDF